MKLYLISRPDEYSYDEYSDAVVAARSEEEAGSTHPSGDQTKWESRRNGEWIDRNAVIVKEIGLALDPEFAGVICASFHAG